MNLIIANDYDEMSRIAASYLLGELAKGYERRVNVSITGGSTPAGTYEYVKQVIAGLSIPGVHYYNFDEIPMKGKDGATLAALRDLFYKPCKIPENQIERFDETNYLSYDQKLEADGGLDLMLLGLGGDGHFCGNISGAFEDFGQGCYTVDSYLNEELTGLLADACGGMENVPEQFVTFGPSTVMKSRKIILIVNGEKKAEILRKALEEPITPKVPASVLCLHPNFTVIADKAAASKLKKE